MLQSVSQKTNARHLSKFHQPQNTVFLDLRRQVANAFNLYLNYKQYHWKTIGTMSRDLNIIFDEFATEVYNTVEVLDERVRMIGQYRLRVKEFSKTATIKPAKKENKLFIVSLLSEE